MCRPVPISLPSGLGRVLLAANVDLGLAGAPLVRGHGVQDARDVAAAAEPRGLAFISAI